MILNSKSQQRLETCHPDLIKVIRETAAHSLIAFQITEGIRTLERQKELVAKGKSKTMNSRHLPGADGRSKAVDVVCYDNGKVTWNLEWYRRLCVEIRATAKRLGISVIWGNDWDDDGVECGPDPDESFVDACHFELNRRTYP